jgi:CDP-diacylglycerol--serine O-phosphatidyltransferase
MLIWLKNNLPNFLTSLNLACGVTGIFLLAKFGLQKIEWIEYLVLIAGLADFFDGFLARLLKSASAIGKDLDSLADCVTFGALPALVLFLFLENQEMGFWSFSAILVSVFSAIRLAIFNNDTRQSDQFIGVPTPANGFFIVFLVGFLTIKGASLFPNWFLASIPLFTAIWLVLPVPLLALKFKSFSFSQNWPRFIVLLFGIAAIFIWGKFSISLIVLFYLAVSLIVLFFPKNAVQSQG